jgi:hypothetical protein
MADFLVYNEWCMNGDQQTQTPGSGWQPDPGVHPPSLTEPSQTLPQPEAPKPAAVAVATPSPAPVETPPATPTPAVAAPAPVAPATPPVPQTSTPEEAGFFHPSGGAAPASHLISTSNFGQDDSAALQPNLEDAAVTWVSSGESVQAHSSAWRLRMTIFAVVAAGLIFLLTRDPVPTIAVAFSGLLFGFLGSRKPAPLSYRLDTSGITIGNKHHVYSDYRAFSIGEYPSLNASLVPLKRFAPTLSLSIDPALQDKIITLLSARLPMEQHKADMLDKLVSRVRF